MTSLASPVHRGVAMRTSAEGLVAIMAYEALFLIAYDDGTGVWTIGVGHTAAIGPPAPLKGMTLTFEESVKLFQQDIAKCEGAVEDAIKVPLSQQQFDALVSWELNCGSIRNKTTTLKKMLNASDYDGAADQLLRWNKAKGKVLDGLTNRRRAEREIFLRGDYGAAPVRFRDKDGSERSITRANMLAMVRGVLGAEGGQPPVSTRSAPVDQPDDAMLQDIVLPPDSLARNSALQDYPANQASAILPRYRPRQSVADTRATYAAYSHMIPAGRQNDAVALLAVRGYYEDSFGVSGSNDRGFYDDALFVIEPEHIHNFNANTDPSIQRNGIATLVAPQAVLYKPGYHGFQSAYGHQAFRQASPVTVSRDGGGEQSDRGRSPFWINLHRGGNTRTSSEGCQTIPPSQWPEFKPLIDGLLRQYGQEDFYYLLITQDQLEAALTELHMKTGGVAGPIIVGPMPPRPRAGDLILRRDDTAPQNSRVSALQMALKKLGYELGAVNGCFGTLTQGALLSFQADNNLPKSGELDAVTQAMLDKGPMRPLSRERTSATEADVIAAGSSTVRNAVSSRIMSWITAGFGALGIGNSAVINAGSPAPQPAGALLSLLDEVSKLGAGTPTTETLKRLAEVARGMKDAAASGAPPELLQALLKLKSSLPADALAGVPEIDRVIGVLTRAVGLKPGGMGTIFDILPGFFADGTIPQTIMKGVALTASSTLPGFAGSAALVVAGLAGRMLANRIAEARVNDHREGKNIGN